MSTEELVLPRHARCVLSRFRCNGHSLLLGSYLSRIGRIENSSCSACGHSSQDISHLILHCPATDSLRRSLFGDPLSLYDLWSRPWGVARLLGLHGLPPCPIPRKGSGNQQQQAKIPVCLVLFLIPNDEDTYLTLTDIIVLINFTSKHKFSKPHKLFPIFCALFYEAHILLHISIHL